MSTVSVDGKRLWLSLMQMAEIGATKKGGCNRQALTAEDKIGRDLFQTWCSQAGCEVRVDVMGNIFARREGRNTALPPVITGSHLDTQPTGGKFDGVYGVLAGLEVLRCLNDGEIMTEHPIEVVVWTNEEGARFSPAMIGSGVWAGEFTLDYGLHREDKQGISIETALGDIGYLGTHHCNPFPIKAAFELHIEQGPILEDKGLQIGVVKGVQGMRWYDLNVFGDPVHAGPTPMERRRDAMKCVFEIGQALYQMVQEFSPWSRLTFGEISALPGARNTLPEKVILAIDLRHPEQQILDEMDNRFRGIVKQICEKHQLKFDIQDEWNSPAVEFDRECIDAVRASVHTLGYSHLEMFSGAGHDSVYVSRVAPTSMIFIPCDKGISHNEAENVSVENAEAGANVLLGAMLRSAVRTDPE